MEDQKNHLDAFGGERTPEGKAVVPEAAKVEDKKPDGGKPADTTTVVTPSPEIAELRENMAKLERDKASMGENLSAQRKAADKDIKELKQKLSDLERGTKTPEVPYKDIKRVKDLPKDQQEAMTDTEKQLWDENADMKEQRNRETLEAAQKASETASAADRAAAEAAEKTDAEKEKADKQKEFDTAVHAAALALAGKDKDVANKIIAEFNDFDNSKLDPKDIPARMEKAALLVPDYKPVKEPNSPRGSAVGGAADDDKYGNNAIIEQARQGQQKGGYAL